MMSGRNGFIIFKLFLIFWHIIVSRKIKFEFYATIIAYIVTCIFDLDCAVTV